jgi:hypothetical protein
VVVRSFSPSRSDGAGLDWRRSLLGVGVAHAFCIGRSPKVPVDVPGAYEPTVMEAMRALGALFDTWRRTQLRDTA